MLTVLFWIDSQRSHFYCFIFENHSCHLLCLGGILSAMNWSWLIVELLTVTMLEWDQFTVGTCLSDVLIIYNNRLAANTSVLDVDLPWIQSRSVNNIMLLFSTRWIHCTMIQHNSKQNKNILHSSDIFFSLECFWSLIKMKVIALSLVFAVTVSYGVKLDIQPFRRLIPADVLRGNPDDDV